MNAPPTIIEALASPSLFAGLFDAPTWRPWVAFLRALYGLPLEGDDLDLYRHHTGRTAPPVAPFREAELVCGRRGGKSRILGLLGVYLATVPDYTAHTAPGEIPVVAIIAADRRQARVIFSYVTGLLHAVPALEAMIVDELAETVRLANGVAIEIHTSSIGAPRGRTFIAVLADEIAFWDTGDAANPDKEVIAAVRPGLATLPGSLLLVASSPYARRGFLFDTFSRYYGRDNAPVLVWRGTTQEMNSGIDPRIIAEAFEADPESAEAEYNANFRSDITAFIGRDAVLAVVADGILELPPAAGLTYAAFVDPSGGSADSMTLAIAHMGSDGIAVLDAVRERRPPFSPEDVTTEFCDLLRTYRITRVTGDAYAGEWPRERFSMRGVSYELSGRNKSAIYQDFLPALNGRRIRLLDQSRLTAQLCNLERRVSRGGKDSIDHGPGQHDDVANCVCGALTLVINDRRPTLIPAAALRSDDEAPPEPGNVLYFYCVVWIDVTGSTAWALFARRPPYPAPQILICDYGVEAWHAGLLDVLARRIGDACDAARAADRRCRERGVGGCMIVPTQIEAAAQAAMRAAAAAAPPLPLPRRAVALAIDARLLADPVRLAFQTSAHVTGGLVKMTAAATARAATVPLMGVLSIPPGAKIEDDPLRLAVMLGVVVGLESLPAQDAHGARTTFR